MSECFESRINWFYFLVPVLLIMVGCGDATTESVSSTTSDQTKVTPVADTVAPKAKPALPALPTKPPSNEFEPAVMVTADGKGIKVEEPGYACPALFDMDKDGVEDLIVGQFNGGKMKWYRNLSSPSETPKYAKGEWIKTGDAPAEVPGVS